MLGTIMCYGPVVDWNMKAGHPYNEYALVFVCIFYFICICDVKILKVYFVNVNSVICIFCYRVSSFCLLPTLFPYSKP